MTVISDVPSFEEESVDQFEKNNRIFKKQIAKDWNDECTSDAKTCFYGHHFAATMNGIPDGTIEFSDLDSRFSTLKTVK